MPGARKTTVTESTPAGIISMGTPASARICSSCATKPTSLFISHFSTNRVEKPREEAIPLTRPGIVLRVGTTSVPGFSG